MTENTIGTLKPFNDLDEGEKIRAILATVREPVTRDLLFHFAGIDPLALMPEQVTSLDLIISENKAELSADYIGPDKFWVPLEKQESSIKDLGVDGKTVHGQIADVLMKDLGL